MNKKGKPISPVAPKYPEKTKQTKHKSTYNNYTHINLIKVKIENLIKQNKTKKNIYIYQK